MRNTILIPFLLIILISSCSKSSSNTTAPPVQPYLDMNSGSSWQYESINNPGPGQDSSSFTLTATTNDTTIDGKSYQVFDNSNGANQYYYKTGDQYYTYEQLIDSSTNVNIEDLYLQDNLGINGTWSQAVSIPTPLFSIPITITDSIVGKGISKTVYDSVYNNVIEVSMHISSSAIPDTNLISNIHNYYAPGYGLIESDVQINLDYIETINVNTQTKIISASLK